MTETVKPKRQFKGMKCPDCGQFMRVVFRRNDGCRMFSCIQCDADIGEETPEFFEQLKKEGLM